MSGKIGHMAGVPIERLVGRENYSTWKIAVNAFLDMDDLWEGVVEIEQGAQVDADKDRKARNKLKLCIDPTCYTHIQSAKTANEIWKSLSNAFEDNGLTRRCGLLRKLIMTSYEKCNSMEHYVSEIVNTAHQLSAIGLAVGDEWVGMLLLCGLPESYRPMILGLENSGMKITGDAIKTKLLQEMPHASDDHAFVSTRDTRRPPRRPFVCYNCGKEGHSARDCRRNNARGDGERFERRSNAMITVYSALHMKNDDNWYFDSGATTHMTKEKKLLVNQRACVGQVFAADGRSMDIESIGNIELNPSCRNSPVELKSVRCIPGLAANLISVSEIVNKGMKVVFDDKGCKVIDGSVSFRGFLVATGEHVDNLFKLKQVKPQAALSSSGNASFDKWHRRMGHLNPNSLNKLQSKDAVGIRFKDKNFDDCDICATGKQAKLPFNQVGSRAREILDVIHSDICGPMEMQSLAGSRYYLTFTDDKSRMIFVFFLKTKSAEEVLACFKTFVRKAERQSGRKIKCLRTDNGTEYVNRLMQNYLRNEGITHQRTNPYTPEQNGVSERNNRSISDKARCMLLESKLPKEFWAEAVNYSVYLLNRSPSSGIDVTPYELWTGKQPDLSSVRIFGTSTSQKIPDQRRLKWDPKGKLSIFVGIDEDIKGYRLCDMQTRKISTSRNVVFLNEGRAGAKMSNEVSNGIVYMQPEPEEFEVVNLEANDANSDVSEYESSAEDAELDEDTLMNEEIQVESEEQQQIVRRSNREKRPPRHLADYDTNFQTSDAPPSHINMQCKLKPSGGGCPGMCEYPTSDSLKDENTRKSDPQIQSNDANKEDVSSLQRNSNQQLIATPDLTNAPPSNINTQKTQSTRKPSDGGCPETCEYPQTDCNEGENTRIDNSQMYPADPETIDDALSSPDASQWKLAMEVENQALLENRTWTLVDRPRDQKVLPCKWVFRTKRDLSGKIEKFKARLVIKGFMQRKGVNYDETYSPVVRHCSLRYLFATAAYDDMRIDQMDALSAYLQGTLHEEVYMELPPLYEDNGHPNKCCRLQKAIYGLKQGGRVWNNELDSALLSFGLKKSSFDPCVYFQHVDKGRLLILAVYVDDILLFYHDKKDANEIKNKLNDRFKMKDLGPAQHILGMRLIVNDDFCSIDQENYIENVIDRFGMSGCNSIDTPMNQTLPLSSDDCPRTPGETLDMKDVPYQEAVGCLMYVSQCTRPDITFAVNKLSRFNSNPGKKHWEAVKHLLRFLKGTKADKLTYWRKTGSRIGLPKIVGYVDADHASEVSDRKSVTGTVFIAAEGAVSWNSKKQTTIALSSCESEFVALSCICQEAIWWNGFVRELGLEEEPMEVYSDNQAAITLGNGDGFNPRTKHIDVRFKFAQEAVARKEVKINHVGTAKQKADILTKPLGKIRFQLMQYELGIQKTS